MRRPGPLQELPLDQFLPSSSKSTLRPNKRPLSPGAPNPFSPTKRRILEEEGIFSPDKTTKSPFPSSRGKTTSFYTAVLCSSDSPARRLDFSPSKGETGRIVAQDKTPAHSSIRRTTTPSAKHTPALSNFLSSSTPFEEYEDVADDQDFELASSLHLRMIPREMPPPPDPQSAHYPGFTIYQDTHILLPHVSDLKQDGSALLPMDDDFTKENIAPRRKMKKATTLPLSPAVVDLKKLELSNQKARSMPITPRNSDVNRMNPPSPTPRRPTTALSPMSAMTPKPGAGTRRELRRMLEEEVDEVDGHDDESIELSD